MLRNRVNDFRIKVFTGVDGGDSFPEFLDDGAHEIYGKMNSNELLIPCKNGILYDLSKNNVGNVCGLRYIKPDD